ncbi:MAG: hypothetical protein ABMA25_02460 [Ilumatobacteraceae bacterium]
MRTPRRLLASLLAVGFLAPVAVTSAAAPSPAAAKSTAPVSADEPWRSGLTPRVDDIAGRPDAPPAPTLDPALSRRSRTEAAGTTAAVEIWGDDAAVAAAVTAAGGQLGRGGGGLHLATVRLDRLAQVANAAGVVSVRRPAGPADHPVATPKIERGPLSNGTDSSLINWFLADLTGQGSKVGIIGLFDTAALTAEATSGDLATIPAGARYCVSNGATCPFGTPGQTWGNSLAEIVADGAPNASLFLAELGYRTDYYAVIDWFASKGVTILVNPLIWTYDGPGNGTGPSAAIVDYAVSKGIAWFNTAGEMGATTDYTSFNGTYWKGVWADTDGDRWLNFKGADESMAVYCGFLLGLRWSDWGASPTDYDLYIADYKASSGGYGALKLLSGTTQGQPLEGTQGVSLCNTNTAYGPVYDTNKDGLVSLWVQRRTSSPAAGAVGDTIEIGTSYGWLEYANSAGGVGIAFADSRSSGMVTVGGREDISQFPRSSSGPTVDGRVKPTLVAPICNSTSVAGGGDSVYCGTGYFGTDGSAAYAAGLAALANEALHFPNAKATALFTRDQAYDRWANKSRYGFGDAGLPAGPPDTTPRPSYFDPSPAPVRILDTRSGLGTTTVGPLPADGTVKVDLPITTTAGNNAVVLNVAVVNSTGPGWLSVYTHGWSYPSATSALNVEQGQTRANMVVVPINGMRQVDVYTRSGGNIIVDVLGYFRPTGWYGAGYEGGTGRLRTLSPFRAFDSRACNAPPCANPPYAAGSYIDVPLAGVVNPNKPEESIPTNASAVALSLTVDSPAAKGFASVIPGGSSAITTSSTNFDANRSTTTTVFAVLNETGNARVYLSAAAHVQVDVLGYFSGVEAPVDNSGVFVSMTPRRALDTRVAPAQVVTAGSHRAVSVTPLVVPKIALAVLLNNVSVDSTAPGELEVGATVPTAPGEVRNLTYPTAAKAIAATTISAIDQGQFVLSPSATTHLVSDLSGYWTGHEPVAPAGSVVKVTTTWNGSAPNGQNHRMVDISNDGNTVLFTSNATNFVEHPIGTGVFLWERSTNTVTEFPYATSVPRLSGDGSTIVFATGAVLVPEDTDGFGSIYVFDRDTATLSVVSKILDGGQYNSAYATGPQVSDDGNIVAWVESASYYGSLHWYNRSNQTTGSYPAGFQDHEWRLHEDGTAIVGFTHPDPVITSISMFALPAGTRTSLRVPFDLDTITGWTTDHTTLTSRTSIGGPSIVQVTLPVGPARYGGPRGPYSSANSGVTDATGNLIVCVNALVAKVCNVQTGAEDVISATWNGDFPNDDLKLFDGYYPVTMSSDGRFAAYSTAATNVLDETTVPGNIYIVDRTLL